jgi:hypothetical protein
VSLTIRGSGFDAAGIRVITAASEGFEARVRALAGEWGDAVLLCAPQLAIIRNESPHTIVAYAVAFKSLRTDGRFDRHLIQFKYPDAVAATDLEAAAQLRDRELRPSDERLIGREFVLDPTLDNRWIADVARWQQAQLAAFAEPAGLAAVESSLDAVLLDDGRLFGENRSQLDKYFQAYLDSKQQLYRAAISLMSEGKSFGDALRTLKSTLPWAVEDGKEPDFDARLALGDLVQMATDRGEDHAARAVWRAVRSTPFAIRRVDPPR